MQATRARAAGLFGVLVIAIMWVVWHPSTLSGTRYVGLEAGGSNQGTAAGAFEQVSPATTPAPARRDNGGLRPHFQRDGTGQPAAPRAPVDYGALRPHFQGDGGQPAAPRAAVDHGGLRPHFQGYGTGQPAATPVLTLNVAGRGGRIFRVNTLADDRAAPVALGDGTYRSSLRAAVEAEGPRVVVFETSGVICLTQALIVYEPFLTIAGQTAPSPGINVRCAPFKVDTHDVLLQHIRFRFDRMGYPGSNETWPVQIGGSYNWTYNVVLDHLSVAFGNGYMSIGMNAPGQPNPWDVAVLDSLMAWPLATGITSTAYELTGYGMRQWGVGNGQGTAARNLFVHSSHRNLSAQGGKINWVNNAILGSGPTDGYTTLSFQGLELTVNDSNPRYALLGVAVNNQFLPSISTGSGITEGTRPGHHTFDFYFIPENVARGDRIYLAGNLGPRVTGPTGPGQWSGVYFEGGVGNEVLTETVPAWYTAQQFDTIPTETLPSALARTAGARPADRDSVDALAIDNFLAAASGDQARMGSRISTPGDLGLDLTLRRNLRELDVPANPNDVVDAAGRTRLEEWLEAYALVVEGTETFDLPGVGLTANRPAPQPAGTPITFTATATGEGPHQYKWWVYDGALWTIVQDWSAGNTFTWQPALANPAYIIAVWARSASTTTDTAEASALLPFAITGSALLQVGLTANRQPPQMAGTAITFTAAATAGQAPYQYKFRVFDGATWTVVQDWSSASTFTWQPATPNAAYKVAVWARSATTTADIEEASAELPFAITSAITLQVRLTANLPAPQPAGTAITFTAAASGGEASYQYKWWVYDGVAWRIVQDWSVATGRFTWQPATANAAYIVAVWVRNASTTTDTEEASALLPFAITAPVPLQVGLTANRQPPQMAGTAITFTAAATGGQGSYQYKWWVYDGAIWTIVQDWSASSTFIWQPTQANAAYRVGVWVRNASTTTDTREASAELPFAITPVPLQVGLTANRQPPQMAGTAITFTAAATAGQAPYQYKFLVFDGATWTVVRDWSTSNTFTWQPATANPAYIIAVWARSATTTADTKEASAELPFAITPVPLQVGLTANRQPPQMAGTAITFTAAATAGQAPYQYKFLVFDGATSTVVRDWSSASTFTWQPALPNPAYTVAVWARSATTTTDTKEASAELPFAITPAPLQVGLTANRQPPQMAGTAITFTAAATGGQGSYQYKWWVYNGALWTIVQDWSASSTFTWQPATANAAYIVAVWVRNASTTTDTQEASALLPFAITAPAPLQVGLTANRQPPQMAGIPIMFTAAATGGQGSYQYKWWVYDGVTWTIVQDWSASSTFTWQPAAANAAYRVGVWVRNASTTTDTREASAELPFAITAPAPLQVGLTANRQPPQMAGTAITFTAAATGGQGSYQYKWWVYDGVTWTIVQDWSASSTFTWQPAAANAAYRVGVWVRNASTTTDTKEASAEFFFEITQGIASPTTTWYVNASTGHDTNNDCTEAQNPATPMLTIAAGIACVTGTGNTVDVANGTYPEALSSFPAGPLTIRSATTGGAIIEPVGDVEGVNMTNETDITIEGFVFDGTNSTATLVYITGGSGLVLRNNEFRDVNGGLCNGVTDSQAIYAVGATGALLQNNYFHDIRTTCSYSHSIYWASHDSTIEGNTMQDVGGGCIQVYSSPALDMSDNVIRSNVCIDFFLGGELAGAGIANYGVDNVMYNNIIYSTTGGGRQAGMDALGSGTDVYHNTLFNLGYTGIQLVGNTTGIVRNNIIWDVAAENIDNIGGSNTCTDNLSNGRVDAQCSATETGDPLFANEGTFDLTLTPGSPAINTGFSLTGIVDFDYLGVARPQGAGHDIGAYEEL